MSTADTKNASLNISPLDLLKDYSVNPAKHLFQRYFSDGNFAKTEPFLTEMAQELFYDVTKIQENIESLDSFIDDLPAEIFEMFQTALKEESNRRINGCFVLADLRKALSNKPGYTSACQRLDDFNRDFNR